MKPTHVLAATVFLSLGAIASARQVLYPPTEPLPVSEIHIAGADKLSDEDRKVFRLMADDLEAQHRFDPISASMAGDHRYDDRLPDVSTEGRQAWFLDTFHRQQQLYGLNPGLLTPVGDLHRGLLDLEFSTRLERHRFSAHELMVSQQSGPQITLPQLPDNLSFTTDKQLEDYIKRLEAVPQYLADVQKVLLDGIAAAEDYGSTRTPPRVVMGAVPDQAAVHGDDRFLKDPTAHAMYRPFLGRNDELAKRAQAAIREKVVPAFKEYADFLRKVYVPRCRSTISCSDLPLGRSYYEVLVRHHTTQGVGAEEIHQRGLAEVARIRAEMMDVIARSDFSQKNKLKGEELFKAFVKYLRTDKRFYYTNAEDLLNGYRVIAKEVDAELPRLFGKLPRLPYGVREMPRYIAPSAPTAYYYRGSIENGLPGWFIANVYKLDQRPKYEMIPLTLHEAVPGHHLQVALAQELKASGLPEWRETLDYTAFIEGWGLYAERLGLDMNASVDNPHGLYADPYDDFGRLSYEMWRAMRLVVDTGIHAMDWTREQAVQYMLENSALTEENINREVDRYIAWPGQALAYKVGELCIRGMRERYEKELGAKFDIRGFHDAILSQGAVPLDVLETQVAQWAERVKASK